MQGVLDSQQNQNTKRRSHAHEDLSMSTFSDTSSLNENDNAYGGQPNGTLKSEKVSQSYDGDYKSNIGGPGYGTVSTEKNIHHSPISSPTSPFSIGGEDFALVVNGHSLVYALTPELELLFLSVAENCSCKSYFVYSFLSLIYKFNT
jgi:hypothetical protein